MGNRTSTRTSGLRSDLDQHDGRRQIGGRPIVGGRPGWRPLLAAASFILLISLAEPNHAGSRPAEPRTVDRALPLLEPGLTLGTTRFGVGSLPPDDDPVTQRVDEAVAAGLGGFTAYIEWPVLEPEPGVYRFDELLSDLDRLHSRGLSTYLNITVGDIGDYLLPPEFSDGEGGLAEGVALDDSQVIERFRGLLDALVPQLPQRGVFALGVGNEIDDRLDGEFSAERMPYARFAEAANVHVDLIEPNLAVGVTLTATAHLEPGGTLEAMRDAVDFVAVNYAPIDPDFFVLEEDAIQPAVDELLATFGAEPIVIQELTCPSTESMNASPAWQASCFELLLDRLMADRRVRFASVFTLSDFGEPLCSEVQAVFPIVDAAPDFIARFRDYLCTLGVLDPDAQPKPAWGVLLEGADAVPGSRLDRLRRLEPFDARGRALPARP